MFEFLLSVLFLVVASDIVQVHVVVSECDKIPNSNRFLKLEKYPETNLLSHLKMATSSSGFLTPLGIRQCYEIGKNLSMTYLNETSPSRITNIQYPTYYSSDYYFLSDYYQASLVSAQSMSLGLFPRNEGRTVDVGTYAGLSSIPTGSQLFPVYSENPGNSMLDAQNSCPEVVSRRMKQKFENIEEVITELQQATGNKITDEFNVYDLYLFLKSLKSHLILPTNLTSLYEDKISHVGTSLYRLFNSALTLDTLASSQFLSFMKQAITNKPYKFGTFISQDVLITSILSSLKLLGNKDLKGPYQPGASLIFEVHSDKTNKNFILLKFKNSWDGETKTIQIPGCEISCPLQKFLEILGSLVLQEDEWCERCNNAVSPPCILRKISRVQSSLKAMTKREQDMETQRDQVFVVSMTLGLFIVFLLFLVLVLLMLYICERGVFRQSSAKIKKSHFNPI